MINLDGIPGWVFILLFVIFGIGYIFPVVGLIEIILIIILALYFVIINNL